MEAVVDRVGIPNEIADALLLEYDGMLEHLMNACVNGTYIKLGDAMDVLLDARQLIDGLRTGVESGSVN